MSLSSYYSQLRKEPFQPVLPTCEVETLYANLLESEIFLFSQRQQMELACILEEFRNRPLNQKNYLALQRELAAAELMPDQLFCYDLGDEQQRKGNLYLSHLVQSWQKMSMRGMF